MLAEVKNVRNNVGLMEISTYAKYEVTGSGAEAFLSRVLAGRMPKTGRIALNPMLNDDGKIIGDFTVSKLAENRFFIIGAGVAEHYHMRWFEQHMPPSGVAIKAFGTDLVGLTIAGPKSRDVLASLVADDLSTAAFPFLSIRRMDVGLVPALVARISFTGDLGYELWVKPEHQRALFEALLAAGEPHGIGLFGARALNAMRLEKGYGSWAREYRPIYTPREAGMDRTHLHEERSIHWAGCDGAALERDADDDVVEFLRRRERCRRLWRRAYFAWRQGGRLGHVRWLFTDRETINRHGLRLFGIRRQR